MENEIEQFLKNKKELTPFINDFTWETEYEHANNNDTMNEWIEEHLPPEFELIEESLDGSYAEIITFEGHKFACHASGNGDFCNHKIVFELIEENLNSKNDLKETKIKKPKMR